MIKWSKEPDKVEFMKNYIPGHTEAEIRKAFNDRFEITLTESQIENFKTRYGIKSGTHGGCFRKSNVPHNKGKKMSPDIYKKIKHTMFKKEHIPTNHREVGSERVNVDGYVELKVAEPNKWMLKQRKLYEDYHNEKLTSNDVIIFLDNNKFNFDKDNLIKLTRAELIRFNQDHLYCGDKDITKVAVSIAKIKARKNRGGAG